MRRKTRCLFSTLVPNADVWGRSAAHGAPTDARLSEVPFTKITWDRGAVSSKLHALHVLSEVASFDSWWQRFAVRAASQCLRSSDLICVTAGCEVLWDSLVGANYSELNSGFDDGWLAREVAMLTDHATPRSVSFTLAVSKGEFTRLYLSAPFEAPCFTLAIGFKVSNSTFYLAEAFSTAFVSHCRLYKDKNANASFKYWLSCKNTVAANLN
jgi:hypothetical protein